MLPISYSDLGDPEQLPYRAEIRSDLIRIIYDSIPTSLLTILVNSGILSFILWDVTAHQSILVWFSITNLLSIVRYILLNQFNAIKDQLLIPQKWADRAVVCSAFSGALWGATSVWLFPVNEISHQVFLAFVIAGMCAGAVTTLSAKMSALITFVLLSLVPMLGQFLAQGTYIGNAMSMMTLLFIVMILLSSKRLNRTIQDSLLIRHEKNIADETIKHQAYYDDLTHLPNRRYLKNHLKKEISRAVRHGHYGSIIFIDLDFFKAVNDSMGHDIGDDLLRRVSERLSKRIRDEDTVGRLSGDEFVVIVSDSGKEMSEAGMVAQGIAEEIFKQFSLPFFIQGHEIHLTSSIGISLYPMEETNSDELLRQADVAMYQAKEEGRNAIKQFLPEMQFKIEMKRSIEKGLRHALNHDELEVYYQPILNDLNQIVCAEALLRWNHPEKGVIAPGEFIEVAERTGLIVTLGDWVLKSVCSHLNEIVAMSEITVSVNISPRQFNNAHFIEKISNSVLVHNIDPNRIQLEITEGMMISDIQKTIEIMNRLKVMGFGISIDDFGTGYSSLSYLKQLPINILKIDKSFVLDIESNIDDAVIVETIISMAQHLKIDVIAEGVETEKAYDLLKSKGCHNFQGYLFSRPMPFTELKKFITQLSS